MGVIGGADGPTTVFLAGDLGAGWINLFGIIILVLLAIPYVIFALTHKIHNRCRNKLILVIEQVGLYGSILFMILNIGKSKFGFGSVNAFLAYMFINAGLLITYFVVWGIYSKKQSQGKGMALAIIPSAIFFMSGVLLIHWPLIIMSIVFGYGHIYVTYLNQK